MLRITELKLPIDHPEEDLRTAIVQRLGIASDDLLDFTLFKRSYDARKKTSELCFIYTVDLNVKGEAALLLKFADDRNVNPAPDVSYKVVGQAPEGLAERPIVVGFGPCGIFAGLLLAQMGFKPIILERGKRVDGLSRIGRACHRSHRELQPERPAVDTFEQARARVGVDPLRKARADQRDRLVEREAQPVGARERALPAGEQVAGRVIEPAPGRDDHPQVLRRVVQHVGQRVEAGGWQPLRVVDDQQRVDRQLRDFGQPRGQPLQRAGGTVRNQAPEAGPRATGAHRLHEPLQQARCVVALVGGQPHDGTAQCKGFAAPLREQRGLAVAGRRLHERDGPRVERRRGKAQPRTREQLRRHARRGRLQHEFGGGRVGAIGWVGHRGRSGNPAMPCGPASGVGVGEGSTEPRSRVNPPRDEWGRTAVRSIAWVPMRDERNRRMQRGGTMDIVSTGARRSAPSAG